MTSLKTTQEIRAALIEKQELALFDLREEADYALGHPLFAANLPLGRLELEIFDRVPRRDTQIIVYDDENGLVEPALERLSALGYSNLHALAGGLGGWRAACGEIFQDVNVPSKAFGELVEARRHTPSLPADAVKSLLDQGADLVVLDARRFEEYRTMSIPNGQSVPGGELVYRVRDLAPRPETLVIVNCAGRTRSIIGAQSLINAGIPNPVRALRNGTIGWTLAGLSLDHGQTRRFGGVSPANLDLARQSAGALAAKAGVTPIDYAELPGFSALAGRTLYRFDVRTPEEYAAGHLPGFRSAPGGQLVQETDVFAPVRGARIVLADHDGVRAPMTGSWLAQMGWEVFLVPVGPVTPSLDYGDWVPQRPEPPAVALLSIAAFQALLAQDSVTVLDLARSPRYRRGHIPGAWFARRTDLDRVLATLPATGPIVLTSPDGLLAQFAAAEAKSYTDLKISVLAGGTAQWQAAGFPQETGLSRLLSDPIDVYRRPYEGIDNPQSAMQGYLDWEYGLVDQLSRDGTHGFTVL